MHIASSDFMNITIVIRKSRSISSYIRQSFVLCLTRYAHDEKIAYLSLQKNVFARIPLLKMGFDGIPLSIRTTWPKYHLRGCLDPLVLGLKTLDHTCLDVGIKRD